MPNDTASTGSGDYRYAKGEWTAIPDVMADAPDSVAVDDYLRSIGWESYLTLGTENSALYIETWQRTTGSGYLLMVSDASFGSPFVLADSFPDLMDLLSRWSPAIQAASITSALGDLLGSGFSRYGLVELAAAKAKHGVEETHGQIAQDERERAQAAYNRRQQAKLAREKAQREGGA